MAEAAYSAKDITVLEGLEPVRKRPGMYIGSTGSRGLHHLAYEVVANSVDEALQGRCDLVEVFIHPDESMTVRDTAFLTKGLRIILVDERESEHREEFYAAGGIRDFVAHINKAKEPTHKHIAYFEGESEQGYVEVAMQWNNSYADSVFSFANNINTH